MHARSLSELHAPAMVPAAARPYGMDGQATSTWPARAASPSRSRKYARDAGFTVAGLIELQDPARVGTEVHGLPVRAAGDAPEGAAAVVGAGRRRLAHWASCSPPRLAGGECRAPGRARGAGARVAAPCGVVARGVVVGAASEPGDHVLLGRGRARRPPHRTRTGVVLYRAPTSRGTCGSGRDDGGARRRPSPTTSRSAPAR